MICMCLFVCACEWACALLLHRRNGPTKFLEKSYYHMYTGVGWSEMFMFWFILLSSRVFTTCGLFCLRGVDFLQMCCALMASSVSVASSAWLVFFSAISAELISYEASSVDWLSVVVVVVVVLLFVVVSATAAVAFVVIIAIVVVVVSTNDEAR